VSPFRHGSRWWVQVPTSDRRWRRVSTGTTDRGTARQMAEMLGALKARREWKILDAIALRQLELGRVWDAYRADVTLATVRELLDDVDLSPLVTEWDGRGKRSRSAKYVVQVRRLIPAGARFARSRFTKGELKRFLDELGVTPATKNRYRAALSQFARWLVQRDVLAHNPLRDVDGYTPAKHEPIFLEPHQVRALVSSLPEPYRALEALAAGTGMEWSALVRTTRRDVDLGARMIFARGSKTGYRTRYVECSEDWAWNIVRAHVATLAPSGPLFEVRHEEALRAHHEAAVALKLPRTTIHHHRHSFAVMHIRRGTDHQWIKQQLGHAPDSTLLYTTYGIYAAEAKMRRKAEEAGK
jgi:integrase